MLGLSRLQILLLLWRKIFSDKKLQLSDSTDEQINYGFTIMTNIQHIKQYNHSVVLETKFEEC